MIDGLALAQRAASSTFEVNLGGECGRAVSAPAGTNLFAINGSATRARLCGLLGRAGVLCAQRPTAYYRVMHERAKAGPAQFLRMPPDSVSLSDAREGCGGDRWSGLGPANRPVDGLKRSRAVSATALLARHLAAYSIAMRERVGDHRVLRRASALGARRPAAYRLAMRERDSTGPRGGAALVPLRRFICVVWRVWLSGVLVVTSRRLSGFAA